MTKDFIFDSKRYPCPLCKSSKSLAIAKSNSSKNQIHYCFNCGDKRIIEFDKPDYESHKSTQMSIQQVFDYSMQIYEHNNLARYLSRFFGYAFLLHLKQSNVGSDSQGNTAFWFKNIHNKLTHSKIIPYNKANGKRLKGTESTLKPFDRQSDCFYGFYQDSFLHIFSKAKGYDTKTLFNEHLLAQNASLFSFIHNEKIYYNENSKIIIVESEKTALICSFFFTQFIWLALGGANRLTDEKIKLLENRNIYAFLDNDKAGNSGFEKMKSKLTNLKQIATSNFFTENQLSYDFADLLIENFTNNNNIYDLLERFYIMIEDSNEFS